MPVRKAHAAAIRKVVASIPAGRVCSYGRVAEVAGLPGRARLVGRVLSELTEGEDLPWHRVLRANGGLAFPPDSRSFEMQVRRLADEGIIAGDGRVDFARYGWQTSLDEQLWGPD